jgi:hypothetical protein
MIELDLVYRSLKGSRLDKEEGDANLLALARAITLGAPRQIAQSYTAVTRSSDNATDTGYVTLASTTLPGGVMNLNGELIITQDWKVNASANVKTLALDFGGVNVNASTVTDPNVIRTNYRIAIKNLNSLSSQNIFGHITFGGAYGNPTTSVDTTAAVTIDHKCKWSANVVGEQIALIGYSIWYYPGSV